MGIIGLYDSGAADLMNMGGEMVGEWRSGRDNRLLRAAGYDQKTEQAWNMD